MLGYEPCSRTREYPRMIEKLVWAEESAPRRKEEGDGVTEAPKE